MLGKVFVSTSMRVTSDDSFVCEAERERGREAESERVSERERERGNKCM